MLKNKKSCEKPPNQLAIAELEIPKNEYVKEPQAGAQTALQPTNPGPAQQAAEAVPSPEKIVAIEVVLSEVLFFFIGFRYNDFECPDSKIAICFLNIYVFVAPSILT